MLEKKWYADQLTKYHGVDPDYQAFVESLSVVDAPLPNVNESKDGLSNVERLENRISLMTGNESAG